MREYESIRNMREVEHAILAERQNDRHHENSAPRHLVVTDPSLDDQDDDALDYTHPHFNPYKQIFDQEWGPLVRGAGILIAASWILLHLLRFPPLNLTGMSMFWGAAYMLCILCAMRQVFQKPDPDIQASLCNRFIVLITLCVISGHLHLIADTMEKEFDFQRDLVNMWRWGWSSLSFSGKAHVFTGVSIQFCAVGFSLMLLLSVPFTLHRMSQSHPGLRQVLAFELYAILSSLSLLLLPSLFMDFVEFAVPSSARPGAHWTIMQLVTLACAHFAVFRLWIYPKITRVEPLVGIGNRRRKSVSVIQGLVGLLFILYATLLSTTVPRLVPGTPILKAVVPRRMYNIDYPEMKETPHGMWMWKGVIASIIVGTLRILNVISTCDMEE